MYNILEDGNIPKPEKEMNVNILSVSGLVGVIMASIVSIGLKFTLFSGES